MAKFGNVLGKTHTMVGRPEQTSRDASTAWCHFVLEVLHSLLVPPQGFFQVRHVDGDRSRTVLALADLYAASYSTQHLSYNTSMSYRVPTTQRTEESQHIMTVLRPLAMLLLPDVFTTSSTTMAKSTTLESAAPSL